MNEQQLEVINQDAEQWAWEVFAQAHPHEAYDTNPDRFWQTFHAKAPKLTREQMLALLKETE